MPNKYQKPLSLFPLKPSEALGLMMQAGDCGVAQSRKKTKDEESEEVDEKEATEELEA